jgi:hypothetical protein
MSAYILWDRVDSVTVGAAGPLVFSSEDEAELHLSRMSPEEVAAERYAIIEVPE